jgi:protein-S-isoprenylcysteine O-methyltransferase Ste14
MSGIYICNYLWIGFWALWLLWAIWIKKAERRESRATHFVHAGLAAAGFLLMFWDVHVGWLRLRLLPRALWLEALGIALTLAGFAFAIWARIHLGRNWSSSVTSKVQHELIRSGPYRWVRHPIYSGLLLALFGTALVRGELRAVFSLVLVYAAWKLKSRVEEQMMTSTFGPEYTAYAGATGALFPRLRSESD